MTTTLMEMIKQECVIYGKFTLSSGSKSNYKIDMERILGREDGRYFCAMAGERRIRGLENRKKCRFGIAGVETGGAILAEIIAERLGREHVSINPKSGALKGSVCKERPYAIIDDVGTTGRNMLKAEAILEKHGGEATLAYYIVVRDLPTVMQNMKEDGLELHYELTSGELGISSRPP